jgi:hypothetical protein
MRGKVILRDFNINNDISSLDGSAQGRERDVAARRSAVFPLGQFMDIISFLSVPEN